MESQKRSLLADRIHETRRQLTGLWLKLWGGGFLVVLIGFGIAWFFIEPAPPSTVVIAAGPEDGAYYQFARAYGAYCREHGVTLDVRATAGSLENYELLAEDPEVHLAIVQGGTASQEVIDSGTIESIGSLYLEPVWIFHRAAEPTGDLRELKGQRIAIGLDGSGTQAVARELLAENGIEGDEETVFLPVGGRDAARRLLDGEVDVAFFVLAPSAEIVRTLLGADGIHLVSLDRHEAYARRHKYLTSVTLERGVVDLQRDLPPQDVHLIAPAANLVATTELHDALIPLLLKAATIVHESGDNLVGSRQFPSPEYVEFPLNESARLYFESGPPFLQKYLPFWVASLIDRGKVLLLPLVTLLIPLFRVAPPLYRWRIRSRIYRWYRLLRVIEGDLKHHEQTGKLQQHLKTLAAMERELDEVDSVPLAYMEEFYNLRLHVEFVDRRVRKELAAGSDAPSAS